MTALHWKWRVPTCTAMSWLPCIDLGGGARGNDGRRVELLDDHGPREAGPGGEVAAGEHVRVDPAGVREPGGAAGDRCRAGAVVGLVLGERRLGRHSDGLEAELVDL